MTDSELVAKKLSEIESYVRELQALARPEKIASDVKEERFAAHTLQLAILAALDAASHIVSDGRLGEPRTNRELFELLNKHGWIEPGLAERLQNMVGFRNVLVHGYQKLDSAILVDAVQNRLKRSQRVCRGHSSSLAEVVAPWTFYLSTGSPESFQSSIPPFKL